MAAVNLIHTNGTSTYPPSSSLTRTNYSPTPHNSSSSREDNDTIIRIPLPNFNTTPHHPRSTTVRVPTPPVVTPVVADTPSTPNFS